MKNLSFKSFVSALLSVAIIVCSVMLGYSFGVKNQEVVDCKLEESKAIEGCEIAAMQMRHEAYTWRHRAENCQYHMQELMRRP